MSDIVLNFFSFDCELTLKTIKAPGFNDNAHLHISSICLRVDVSFIVNRNSVLAD